MMSPRPPPLPSNPFPGSTRDPPPLLQGRYEHLPPPPLPTSRSFINSLPPPPPPARLASHGLARGSYGGETYAQYQAPPPRPGPPPGHYRRLSSEAGRRDNMAPPPGWTSSYYAYPPASGPPAIPLYSTTRSLHPTESEYSTPRYSAATESHSSPTHSRRNSGVSFVPSPTYTTTSPTLKRLHEESIEADVTQYSHSPPPPPPPPPLSSLSSVGPLYPPPVPSMKRRHEDDVAEPPSPRRNLYPSSSSTYESPPFLKRARRDSSSEAASNLYPPTSTYTSPTSLKRNRDDFEESPPQTHKPREPNSGSIPRTAAQLPSESRRSDRYQLSVRQQPMAARACGFGERDRRVIDPPPIVQLVVTDPETGEPDKAEMQYPFHVVHCTLWSVNGDSDETALIGMDKRLTRRLMGTLVSSPFFGQDENGEEGCFFVFPDLSCRTHGRYRLRFVLMRLEPSDLRPGGQSPTYTQVLSDVFTVYTAKEFPGMRPSTGLTKALKRQGCAISVKKGNDKALTGAASTKEDDDASGEDAMPESGTKTKRRRKA